MDATSEFFENLGRQHHLALLEKLDGTVRFDIVSGQRTDHVLLTIQHGDIAVSHRMGDANCVVRADRGLFNVIAKGETNAMAALLRGAMAVEGDPGFVVSIQRLFPSPSKSNGQANSNPKRTSL